MSDDKHADVCLLVRLSSKKPVGFSGRGREVPWIEVYFGTWNTMDERKGVNEEE